MISIANTIILGKTGEPPREARTLEMHRKPLLEALSYYRQYWISGPGSLGDPDEGWERATFNQFIKFVWDHEDCFSRQLPSGHITASALITDQSYSKVLLTHHKKLDKWLQLGGHADGESDPLKVALQEAVEESGLQDFIPQSFGGRVIPFDLDIHLIPAHRNEQAHYHYDVRYLFQANPQQPLLLNHGESHDLQWFNLEQALGVTQEWSMVRQFHKLARLQPLPDAVGMPPRSPDGPSRP